MRSATNGRAETWRTDYAERVRRHRADIRSETDRLGWSFAIHRTDTPPGPAARWLAERLGQIDGSIAPEAKLA